MSKEQSTQQEDIQDYLDEDRKISNQEFFVLSYLLPGEKNELKVPMIKVRGSYKTVDECKKKIDSLNNTDKYFHKYICSVGMWGGLWDDESLEKMDEVDIVHRDSLLNSMMKEYKENREQADIHFEERKETMKKRAEFEATPEGRLEMENTVESAEVIQDRIRFADKELTELNARLVEISKIKSQNELLLAKAASSSKALEPVIEEVEETDDTVEDKNAKFNAEFVEKNKLLHDPSLDQFFDGESDAIKSFRAGDSLHKF